MSSSQRRTRNGPLARVVSTSSLVVSMLLVFARCRPSPNDTSEPSSSKERVLEREEAPLETTVIETEEVQTLPTERSARRASDVHADRGRPCAWSSAWLKPDVPDPFLAGVGGAPMPAKTVDAEVRFPAPRTEHSGKFVAEIVIGPGGDVFELTIVRSLEPRWPEAEEAFRRAARRWKYEPPRIGRTPISLCTTILIEP